MFTTVLMDKVDKVVKIIDRLWLLRIAVVDKEDNICPRKVAVDQLLDRPPRHYISSLVCDYYEEEIKGWPYSTIQNRHTRAHSLDMSQIVHRYFLGYSTVSTLKPIVGTVLTNSPSFIW